MTEPMGENERCASFVLFDGSDKEIWCSWKNGHIGCHSTWIDGKKIKWMDLESIIQAKEAEIERLHKFYQEANNDTLGLNQAIHEKELQALGAELETAKYYDNLLALKSLRAENEAKEERIKELEEDKGDWVEMINELKSFKKEKEELRTLVVGLGKASRLLFLSVVDEWMRDENEPNEEIHPSVSDGVIKYREIIALIPEELRKEIDEKV